MWPERAAPNSPPGPGHWKAPATGKRWTADGTAGRFRLRFRFRGLGARTTPAPPLAWLPAVGAATPPVPALAASGTTSATTSIDTSRARTTWAESARERAARGLQRIAQTPLTRFSSSAAPFLFSGSLRLPHFGDCTHDG